MYALNSFNIIRDALITTILAAPNHPFANLQAAYSKMPLSNIVATEK